MPVQEMKTRDSACLRRLGPRVQPKRGAIDTVPRGQVAPFLEHVEPLSSFAFLALISQRGGHDELRSPCVNGVYGGGGDDRWLGARGGATRVAYARGEEGWVCVGWRWGWERVAFG